MYTVEFQKRGLPHAHILLWLAGDNRLTSTADIEKFISAELPHPDLYPKLSNAVASYMIHGPCGFANLKSPCMKGRRCSKYYPKNFQPTTTIDHDGYPCYRRRDSGLFIEKNGIKLDNRSVVPYNPFLLMRYQGHVNVEYCNKSNSIKYLFKYVNKGPDRATIEITNGQANGDKTAIVDEIKRYYDCRYLSPCEAVWRTFGFDIHQRWPPVQRLFFHLFNEQSVLFNDDQKIDKVLKKNKDMNTMFLAWFEANKKYAEGRQLTYAEFPSKFVYFTKPKIWEPRKCGFSIGRLSYVPAGTGELYYMRILLTVQRGCTSYESIRTVNGKIYKTFQEACYVLGLLADDKEFIDAIKEASELASGNQLRRLFVTLLMMNTMTKPDVVWNSTWSLLCDGIVYQRRKTLNIPGHFLIITPCTTYFFLFFLHIYIFNIFFVFKLANWRR